MNSNNTLRATYTNSTFPLNIDLIEQFCHNLEEYQIDSKYPIGVENANDLRRFTTAEIVQLSVTSVLFLIAFVGNSLVIAVVAYNPTLRSPINTYLMNLAVADLLISIVCMWDNVLRSLSYNYLLGSFGCKVGGFIHVTCLMASVFTMVGIAVDRCFAVVSPFKAHLGNPPTGRIVLAIWGLSCLLAVPYCALLKYEVYYWTDFTEMQCKYNPGRGEFDLNTLTCHRDQYLIKLYHILIVFALYILPAILMVLAYVFIVLKLWIVKELTDSAIRSRTDAKKKVVRLAVVVLTAFLLCWTPLQVLIVSSVVWGAQGELVELYKDEFWVYLLAYSNSAINPIIYGGLNKSYRTGLVNLITRNHKQMSSFYTSGRQRTGTFSHSSNIFSNSGIRLHHQRSLTAQTSTMVQG